MFAYWSHKYAHISETVHLRHFMTRNEYHYHCIASDLGYLYLTLSDLRRSNQGQNHSKCLIIWFYTFELKFVCIRMSVRTSKTLLKNKKKLCGLLSISAFRILLDIDCEYIKISTCKSSLIDLYHSKFTFYQ